MRPRILLIEDSAMLRRIASSVLHAQPARYEVIAATRASEGFAQACSGGAQLLLADYRLAGADSLDLCHRLLGEARTARLPVVLLFGRGLAEPDLGALPENVVETLVKPFSPMQLAALVNLIYGFFKSGFTLQGLRARLRQQESSAEACHPVVRAQEPLQPRGAAHGSLREAISAPAFPLNGHHLPPQPARPPATAPVRAAFRQMAAERATGILRLGSPPGATTDVYLEEGRLLAVSTRDARTYGEEAAALLPASVSPATLGAAADEQARTGVPFLLTLGARGLLSKAAAVALVQRFGQRQLARLWAQHPRTVEFSFEALESPPPFALRLEATRESADQWLLESLRLLRLEDVAADARHEGRVGTPGFQPGGEALLQELALSDDEQAFAGEVNGRRDLPGIARAIGLSTEESYLLLFRFRCLEVMDYRPAPAPFVVTPRTGGRRVLPLLR